jgi:hypothetical protein
VKHTSRHDRSSSAHARRENICIASINTEYMGQSSIPFAQFFITAAPIGRLGAAVDQ